MATDREVVQAAYEKLLDDLFATFYSSCLASNSPAAQAEAEQLFKMGVDRAKHVRDRASALLP